MLLCLRNPPCPSLTQWKIRLVSLICSITISLASVSSVCDFNNLHYENGLPQRAHWLVKGSWPLLKPPRHKATTA